MKKFALKVAYALVIKLLDGAFALIINPLGSVEDYLHNKLHP